MEIQVRQPIVVGVPLDDTTPEVVAVAAALGRKLGTAVVPGHAIAPYLFPTARHTKADADAARDAVSAAFAPFLEEPGLEVAEPVVAESSPTPFLLDLADRTHAQMLVVGAGHGATIGGWLLGTVADRAVRTARCPVFVARGAMPGPDRPILCPIDLTPHSNLGLEAALRMARRFGAPLRVLTVLPRARGASIDALDAEAEKLDRATHEEVEQLIRAHDVRDVPLEVKVVGGSPASEILEASRLCSLVVLASRAFDLLVPASVGDVASRVLRESTCGVLAIRDRDPHIELREKQLRRVVELRDDARRALEGGDLERAEGALRVAQTILPGHAALEDDLAVVLDRAGRPDEASRHRTVARILREFHS